MQIISSYFRCFADCPYNPSCSQMSAPILRQLHNSFCRVSFNFFSSQHMRYPHYHFAYRQLSFPRILRRKNLESLPFHIMMCLCRFADSRVYVLPSIRPTITPSDVGNRLPSHFLSYFTGKRYVIPSTLHS